MKGMHDRNILYQGATGEGRPVEGMYMYEIKFGAASLKLEKKFEKEIGLHKETLVGCTLLHWLRETGRAYTIRYSHWLNGDTGHERIIPGKECDSVSTSQQPLGKVGQQRLRAAQIGLSNSGYQGR